jgi:cephalosporin hydroxylase
VISIDLERSTLTHVDNGHTVTLRLDDPAAFALISRAWLRCGWDCKHVYSFTWFGRPIVQLPEDMFRLQEVIIRVRPDVIIEIGVAHGGSLMFHATLCKAMGSGRIIGIDVDIRAHNRAAIEQHELAPYIQLIEGNSVADPTFQSVASQILDDDRVMVLLDGCHTYDHVRAELELYAPLVTTDSYIVAMDGIMHEVAGAPRTQSDWSWNNPKKAAEDFARSHPEFILETPAFAFNEGVVNSPVTYWPSGYLKRLH